MFGDDREVEFHQRGAAHIGDEAGMRLDRFDRRRPTRAIEVGQYACGATAAQACQAGIIGMPASCGRAMAGRVLEAACAVLAVVDAMALPAIGEDRVDIVFADDLLRAPRA